MKENRNLTRWLRFSVLGQIKYGETALRRIEADPECPIQLRAKANGILSDIASLITAYKETLK